MKPMPPIFWQSLLPYLNCHGYKVKGKCLPYSDEKEFKVMPVTNEQSNTAVHIDPNRMESRITWIKGDMA